MTDGSKNTFQLIRRNTGPHTGTTHQNPTFRLTVLDGSPHFFAVIREVDRFRTIRPLINGFMARVTYGIQYRFLQREARVVKSDSNFHNSPHTVPPAVQLQNELFL